MIIYVVMLAVFLMITIGVGIYCRKSASDVNGFVLGGRAIGPWLTAFAFGTSYFSAVVFVGYAGQFGWRFGLASTWIGIGNAVLGSLLAWLVLGSRTRAMTHSLNSKTMPDFFGLRFKSNTLKVIASFIVFIFLIPYTASLFNGLSRLFSMAFPNIDYVWCVALMAVLTGLYVIAGGYVATAWNDFIQGMIMLVGIVAVISAVMADNGGLSKAIEALSLVPNESGVQGRFTSIFGNQPMFLMFVVLLTSFGTWGLPQMVGKFYAIRDKQAIKKGTVISTVFALIVSGGCYFIGSFGRLYGDRISFNPNTNAPIYDSIIPTILNGLPPVVIGIVLVLVLAASMSTLSSLVLTSASTFTLDLIFSKKRSEENDKGKMRCIRIFVAFFICVSAGIAIWQAKSDTMFIAQLMGVSWGALAGAFLAPFLFSLFWKKTTKASCLCSFFVGVAMSLIQLFKGIVGFSFGIKLLDEVVFQSSIHSGVFSMAIGLVLVPLVSLVTKKPESAELDRLFADLKRKNDSIEK